MATDVISDGGPEGNLADKVSPYPQGKVSETHGIVDPGKSMVNIFFSTSMLQPQPLIFAGVVEWIGQ